MKPILTYPLQSGQYIKRIDPSAFNITEEEAERMRFQTLTNFTPGAPNYIFDKEDSIKVSDIKVYITD